MTDDAIKSDSSNPQRLQITHGGRVEQVFALTDSSGISYENPSGRMEPMPSTSLDLDLKQDSLLIITFCARGTVRPSGSKVIPFAFIKCELDGIPCSPDINPIEYHYPQYCCDSRSFTWVVHKAKKGKHKLVMIWGMGNPTSIGISQRTLVVQAVALIGLLPAK
jgi:hypothetical protein